MPPSDHQTGEQSPVWWRTKWLDAMAVANVKPMPRLVAYVYADHARERRDAWVPISRLIERTGMSESTAKRSRRSLVADGWLVETEKAGQHRAALFALTIPEAFRGVALTPLNEPEVSERPARGVTATRQGCQSDTQSISNQAQDQSLSSNQRALMQVIGCEPDDERLRAADFLITSHNVRSAPAWLRSAQKNGDLDDLIANAMKPDTRHIPTVDDYGFGTSRTTATVEQAECTTPDCGQMIRVDRLSFPCPVCRTINKPLLKDVSA